jgi:hypothetical protein
MEFGPEVLDVSYFKYVPTGWVRSTAQGCEECEYFDIHVISKFGPDNAVAGAVTCIELVKDG